MSHLPLSLMNRLNKTQSVIFKLGCCVSKGSLSDYSYCLNQVTFRRAHVCLESLMGWVMY